MVATIIQGMIISFALVSSIGMQNLFVFNSAVSNRLSRALLIAVFVWIADTTLTLIAFLGMGALISRYFALKLAVMAIGGLVVIWMGWGIWRSANSVGLGNDQQQLTLKRAFFSAWAVAFANPQAIIDTGVSLGAFRSTLTAAQAGPFLFGVVSATAIWFFGVTLIISALKSRLPDKFMRWVNLISGAIVMLYGAGLVVTAGRMILELL
ncbi:lyse family l-lysine exporter [Secundilactobacillus kimchicus JCM 15530]|uniref:Lyse family l-lysine exporter n=2 Tax=Secundilactobacillus kimchicus TaxID=528209 RepID=A0A0R1HPX4_9LACO|nr:LysE family transporter [Secundilactobacillus kimchicus]KRK48479.1 lyse family l-lysine exporter [Secundilactobacillus kimchicus JCM 15530]